MNLYNIYGAGPYALAIKISKGLLCLLEYYMVKEMLFFIILYSIHQMYTPSCSQWILLSHFQDIVIYIFEQNRYDIQCFDKDWYLLLICNKYILNDLIYFWYWCKWIWCENFQDYWIISYNSNAPEIYDA